MAVVVVLVRRHCCAVGAAVRRAVDDEVPSAVEEKTGPATVRRMPPSLLDALPVVVVRDVGPRQFAGGDVTDAAQLPRHLRAPITKTSTWPPLCPLSAVTIGPSVPGGWPLSAGAWQG